MVRTEKVKTEAVMKDNSFIWQKESMENLETSFRLIRPADYELYGINPQDVPMGTFASEDHPSFLPSRYGGNAYGLGLMEQSVLSRADTDFLEDFDFQTPGEISRNARRLNNIYQKLGLLIRFSHKGKRYFLIPINLVAHSLQDIKIKADEIEELIFQHIFDTHTEKLDVGVLTSSHDLLVHELAARLTSHRIFLFENLEKLRSWQLPLDIVVLPKDPYEFLLEQKLPRTIRRPMSRKRIFHYAMYLAGKIYDLLEPGGMLHVLAHSPGPQGNEFCQVKFKSQDDLKHFLLFAHTFRTKGKYEGQRGQETMDIHVSDLHYYVNRFEFYDPQLKGQLPSQKVEDFTIDDINRLPHLNFKLPRNLINNPESQWKRIFEPYYETKVLKRKTPRRHHQYWKERLEVDRELPDSLFVYVGSQKKPAVTLGQVEQEIKASGMQGCSLSLVAEYRNSFRYVLDVLRILDQIRSNEFPELSEHERARLSNPFKKPTASFAPIIKLLKKHKKLLQVRECLNPDQIEGHFTPIVENIPKLALHGFHREWLKEILLIVVGHTTMSRIVFGKLPAATLRPITDRAKEGAPQDTLDMLRVCRLMSMAEIAASLGDSFKGDQAREVNRLYEDAIKVATDSALSWNELQDLCISALGGVQNKAVREMLKFFNLFEFLDTWQEYLHKGTFEKEVICDYEPEKLQLLNEALELGAIAEEFKQEFMVNYVFGQSYFFRQFLHSEFHGTGHLFPKLGTRAGFILVWIAVNACERHVINFNPILAGIQEERKDMRIQKIRDGLLRIPRERLHQGFFQQLMKTLQEGRPAFVYDSGLRIVKNPQTHTIDISFVDLEDNMQQINALLNHFESQKLRGINLKNLQDLERRFSELESFHHYLQREGCSFQCELMENGGGLAAKDLKIEEIEGRLRFILQAQVFLPEEIHDNVSILARHCPEILRFFLPELQDLGNLLENWPTREKRSLGSYVMRCLEKFQALVIRDRNAFQNQNAFYQLAKKEFGPLAGEGIGVTPAQMDVLEYLVDRIQQQPFLYQAMTLALLFQEIGKMESYQDRLDDATRFLPHAERGAAILEQFKILKRYRLDPRVERLVILLVRNHGLLGHVIQGEAPLGALNAVTAKKNESFLDVYALQCILGSASIKEGMMVSDLLDDFLLCRSNCFQVMQNGGDWEKWIRGHLRDRGAALQNDFQFLSSHEARQCASHESPLSYPPEYLEDEILWKGMQALAFERLLRLLGIQRISTLDVQMVLQKKPVNFIYHKKKLKSVGFQSFERQLQRAVAIHRLVVSLTPSMRFYFVHGLDHLGGAHRMGEFSMLAGELGDEECVKILFLAFQALHHHFGFDRKGGFLSFGHLVENAPRRLEALQNALAHFNFPKKFSLNGKPVVQPGALENIRFEASPWESILLIKYHDAIQFDIMIQCLSRIWNHEELIENYVKLVQELKVKLPHDTRSFEEELVREYRQQRTRINENILRVFQEELSEAVDFSQLRAIEKELSAQQPERYFSEHQKFLLKEMFAFHLSRLRDDYLRRINQEISLLDSKKDLADYWNQLKYELYAHRTHVGKEYESLIARFIDERMESL